MLPGYMRREMDVTKYNFLCRELAYGTEMDTEQYLMQQQRSLC